jgi:hypothetical protein
MALEKTVTKLWPSKSGADGRVRVGIHLKLTDSDRPEGEQTVIDTDFMAYFGGGHTIAETQDRVTAMAQAAIDKYKSEKQIYGAAAYTNAVTAIDAALTL